MTFLCEDCRSKLKEQGFAFSSSYGPCECCGITSDTRHVTNCIWSDENRRLLEECSERHREKYGTPPIFRDDQR